MTDLAEAVGERLDASPEIADEHLYVFADARNAHRLVEVLPVLLDCAWEPRAGSKTPVSRRGPDWDIARMQQNDLAMLRAYFEWLRSPESESGTLPERLHQTKRSGRIHWSRLNPEVALIRAATDAQIEALLDGAVLIGSTVPGAADVLVAARNPRDGDSCHALFLGDDGQLAYRSSARNATGPSQATSHVAFRPSAGWREEPGGHLLPGEPVTWDLLERLPKTFETGLEVTNKPLQRWYEDYARDTSAPVVGVALPIHCSRSGAIENGRVLDDWVLVRPWRYALADSLLQAAAANIAAYSVSPSATPSDEMDRAVKMPEVLSGFHIKIGHQLSIISRRTGVPELWKALAPHERTAALDGRLDYRRVSASAKTAVRKCMALSNSGLSAYEICEAVRNLEQGAPLEINVFRSHIGSIETNGKWTRLEPDLALPPSASPDSRVVVNGLTVIQVEAGEFRGRTALGQRYLNSSFYDGPASGLPDFSTFHRGNGG